MKRWPTTLVLFGLLAGAHLTSAHAQLPAEPDRAVTAATRTAVIEETLRQLNANYVFPDVARQMEQAVRARLASKEYDRISSARALAETLTKDLRTVSRDLHLTVNYSHAPLPATGGASPPSADAVEQQRRMALFGNAGFERVERLAGNVGYLDLRGFEHVAWAGDTVVAAMNLLAHTDALVIDLRDNGGGSAETVALLSSYLFDQATHLNSIYWRPDDSTRQFWTTTHVDGQRYGGTKNVYVLTSSRTFSAAEEFSYNLKSLKRATIVGETTMGGAHPIIIARLHDHFSAFVPAGRAINPVTKTNWEGTGVQPDVAVPETQALRAAHELALETRAKSSGNPARAEQFKSALEQLRRALVSP